MSFVEFNDWDEAQRIMKEAEDKANASVVDRQREVVYGSYWIRATPDGMLEYGRVLTQEEAEEHNDAATVEQLRDTYRRGYRFSECHSLLGDGVGDTHLAVLWPITKEEYEAAQRQQWQLTYAEWQTAMLRRVIEEQASARPSTGSPQEGL
jgi:hypothetical protein